MDPLDNPVWSALTGEQEAFGTRAPKAARYRNDVSPIAAVADGSNEALEQLATLVEPGEVVAVIAAHDPPPPAWERLTTVELTQWVCTELIRPVGDVAWMELGADDAQAMFELTKATDPGPFERETHMLGDYIGVKDDDRLVAMAGERICFAGFREVSAVCTADGYGGRGYAQALVAEIVARQLERGCASFLHVRVGSPSEVVAARVYGKLGYRERLRYSMQVLRRLG